MTTTFIPDDIAQLPPAPRTLEETGLSLLFLTELFCKVLFLHGRMKLAAISSHVKLPISISERVLNFMRDEHLCELMNRVESGNGVSYQLSSAGRQRAADFLSRCQYAGPAPVTLDAYAAQVKGQSIRNVRYTREHLAKGFDGFVVRDGLLTQLGAGMNSGRAIFIYGPPGSGKTFLAEQLVRLLRDHVTVPYAMVVDNEIIQLFDPHIHHPVPAPPAGCDSIARGRGPDARWQRCRRPMAIAGAELTLNALDLDFDDSTRVYHAPSHVKANNGVFIVDDLGRQLVSPQDLMNRWIFPMDRHHDYLTLHSGYKFQVPFDVVVVFSSNQDPADLADDAFLRRLGYKIHLGALTEDQYSILFRRACNEFGIPFSQAALNYVLQEWHAKENRPLLACYPRDLLGQILDLARYENQLPDLTPDAIDWAWKNYFTSGMPMARPQVPHLHEACRPTSGAQK